MVFLRISWPSTVPLEERRIHCTLQLPKSKWLVYPPWNVHNQPRIRYRHKRVQETEKGDTLPETNSSPLKIDPWKRRFLLETTLFRGKLLVSGGVVGEQLQKFVGEISVGMMGLVILWLIHYTPPFSNLPRINCNYSRYVRIKAHKLLHMVFRSWNNFLNNHLKNWKTLKSANSKTVSFRNMPTLIFMYPFSWSLKCLMTIQSQFLIPEVLAKKMLVNCSWMFLGCGRAAGWHLPVGFFTLTTIYFQFFKKEMLKTYCMVLIVCSKTKEGKRKILYYTVLFFNFSRKRNLWKKNAIAKWSNTIQTLGNKHKKKPFQQSKTTIETPWKHNKKDTKCVLNKTTQNTNTSQIKNENRNKKVICIQRISNNTNCQKQI